jgi:tetratricopeptide (TPR) repeat protein
MARVSLPLSVEDEYPPAANQVSLKVPMTLSESHMQPKFGGKRLFCIYAIALTLLVVLGLECAAPARSQLSNRYLARGDARLTALQYDEAVTEYRRAISLDGGNTEAQAHLKLAEAAPTDIAQLRQFFLEHGNRETVALIDSATKNYPTAKSAVQAGLDFIAKDEYAYARYPLEYATRLDPEYPEAWHYLGEVYKELSKENTSFIAKAQTAEQKGNLFTTKYLNFEAGGGR